jgi:hypothetical protein
VSLVLHSEFTVPCVAGTGECSDGFSSSAVAPNGIFTNGTVQFEDGYVNMHPGENLDLSLIAFIAPVAATIPLLESSRIMTRSAATSVLGAGTQFLAPMSLPSVFNPVGINFTQRLSAGQAVYFTVGASGEYSYDSVGLKLSVSDDLGQVPEPSTWALTAIGSVAAVVARARRRSN